MADLSGLTLNVHVDGFNRVIDSLTALGESVEAAAQAAQCLSEAAERQDVEVYEVAAISHRRAIALDKVPAAPPVLVPPADPVDEGDVVCRCDGRLPHAPHGPGAATTLPVQADSLTISSGLGQLVDVRFTMRARPRFGVGHRVSVDYGGTVVSGIVAAIGSDGRSGYEVRIVAEPLDRESRTWELWAI